MKKVVVFINLVGVVAGMLGVIQAAAAGDVPNVLICILLTSLNGKFLYDNTQNS